MSRARLVPTRIASAAELAAALKGLGFRDVEVHREPVPLQSWQGKPLGRSAEVVVRRSSIGVTSDDVGFARNASGGFDALISDIHLSRFTKSLFAELEKRCPTLVDGAAGSPTTVDLPAPSRELKTPLAVPPAKPPPIPEKHDERVRERDTSRGRDPLRERDQLHRRDPLPERAPLPERDSLRGRDPLLDRDQVRERGTLPEREVLAERDPQRERTREKGAASRAPDDALEAGPAASASAPLTGVFLDPSIRRGVEASLEAAKRRATAPAWGCLVVAALPAMFMLPALSSGRTDAVIGAIVLIGFAWTFSLIVWAIVRAGSAARAAAKEFERWFRPGSPQRAAALASLREHASAVADVHEKRVAEMLVRRLDPRIRSIERRVKQHLDRDR